MSVDLSISGGNIDPYCMKLAKTLQQNNIPARITPNISVLPGGVFENGCVLRFPRSYGVDCTHKLSEVWNLTKKTTEISCAHLWISGKYDGCILDYLRDSICPGKK